MKCASVPFIWEAIEKIRNRSPVILNLTNSVAMEFSANALLALGASPVMAHAEAELEEMMEIACAVVINIGTLDALSIRSFTLACELAKKKNRPLVLDPVGAGASTLRTRTAQTLIAIGGVRVVRANPSEIAATFSDWKGTKGVDSTIASDSVTELARFIAKTSGLGLVVSGKEDRIFSLGSEGRVENGTSLMTCVTAMGCVSSALTAAFLSVQPDPFLAGISAMTTMGICGELAKGSCKGLGSFRVDFLDALGNLSQEQIDELARVAL